MFYFFLKLKLFFFKISPFFLTNKNPTSKRTFLKKKIYNFIIYIGCHYSCEKCSGISQNNFLSSDSYKIVNVLINSRLSKLKCEYTFKISLVYYYYCCITCIQHL